jgi:hypothetical protein
MKHMYHFRTAATIAIDSRNILLYNELTTISPCGTLDAIGSIVSLGGVEAAREVNRKGTQPQRRRDVQWP